MSADAPSAKALAARRRSADPTYRAKLSEASKRAWADPEARAKRAAAMAASPKVRAHMRKLNECPEERRRRSETAQRCWTEPDYRARQEAANEIRSEASRRNWTDPDYRARVLANRTDILPKMAPAQRRFYEKLRDSGFDRDAALAAALR